VQQTALTHANSSPPKNLFRTEPFQLQRPLGERPLLTLFRGVDKFFHFSFRVNLAFVLESFCIFN
jgi:hypothetical protein